MLIPKQAGALCSRGVSPPPNQSREPCRALQQTSTASRSSALPPQRRIRRVRRGRAALPMPCTAARRDATFLPLLLCSLGGWPRLALLDKQAGQALYGSSFAFALACRFIARRPARPGPHLLSPSERSSWGGSADDPSSIHLLEKKRKGPSVTDRSRPGLSPPSITVTTSGLTTPKPQLHRRPHLRPLAAAKEMPRPSASHHRLP